MHSTLCTRVLLNLRKVAARHTDMTMSLDSLAAGPRSRLTFAFNDVGEAGADMDRDLNREMDLGIDMEIGLDSVGVDVDDDGRDPQARLQALGDGG